MVIADIRDRLAREPFEPFRIRSSSGETYPVADPFSVALMRTKVFIAMPRSDRWVELSYLHVAALESLGNGHGRRAARSKRSK